MAAFGRLDIHFADGHSETWTLEGDEISVGSAAGNSIQIADEAISAYHLRLSHQQGIVHLTDLGSTGGTCLDGLRIPAHRPQRLPEAAYIQISSLRLMYYQRSDSPTEAMPAISHPTQPLPIGFRAALDRREVPVWSGASASAEINISNLGEAEAQFHIKTDGLPAGWVKVDRPSLRIASGEDSNVRLQIKPSRRPDIPPGDYPLNIKLTKLDKPERVIQLLLMIKLGGFGGISLALEPACIPHKGNFALHLLNHGNEELSLKLSSQQIGEQLDLQLAQDSILLAPGQRRQVTGRARAKRRPAWGSPTEIPMTLQIQAENASGYQVALPGSVAIKPHLSYSMLGALVTSIAVSILLLSALLYQPPEPAISSFSLSASQVARGTPVALDWEAADALHFVIEVNRSAVAELPADARHFVLGTYDYVDPIDIALIAIQGESKDIETRQLEVYQPITVNRFETNKNFMLRNVRGRLTIAWEVRGAVALTVSQPPGFEVISGTRYDDGRGELVLRGTPADAFVIGLRAEDELGQVTERVIDIALREPECTPLQDAPLYTGPDPRFAQANIAVQNVPVLARGIEASRDWLQLELASGASGWGERNNFYCDGFDPSALTLISDLPPLPTPKQSPTPTAEPLPTAEATSTSSSTPPITAAEVDS